MGFPFSGHLALLEPVLKDRQAIVGNLERRLFGARGKANAEHGDRESIGDVYRACFFESPGISRELARLNGELEAAHLADGFEPARQDGYSRALDPVELVLRACHYWNGTRWPGTNGRLAYAESLYGVFMLGQLERLSLRIWDDRPSSNGDRPSSIGDQLSSIVDRPSSIEVASERLRHVQRLLDLLNSGRNGSGSHFQMVRDARWLIQTAQGPLTRHLKPYFLKAAQVASLPDEIRLEIHRAGAVLAGGHLRSQLRHLSRQTHWAFDDPQLVALTRSSNSMDMALVVRDLVPLLDAYERACLRQDTESRLELADAILQGLSADPELLLTRLDLLGPSTTIEELFVARGDTHVGRNFSCATSSSLGEAHREYLARYAELVGRTAASLRQDARAFDPTHAAYSPLGIVYGFCTDLFSNMVLNTLVGAPSSPDVGLEDVFNSRERLEEKHAQALAWERLPKAEGERDPFEHSAEWAAQMYARTIGALEARADRPSEPNASSVRSARLYVVPRGVEVPVAQGLSPVLAQEHYLTSDATCARATGATLLTADRIAADRAEGRLLASAHSEGAWFGVSKVPLTLCTSQGKDALIVDVAPGVIDVLHRVCPEFLVVIRQNRNFTPN